MRSILPFCLVLTIFHSAWGARIPFEVHRSAHFNSLGRREAQLNVTNNGNAQYIANMSIGGTPVRVLLDTGSSDLWVSFPGTQPTTSDLGKSLTMTYAIGSASGQARSATVQIGPYSVNNQAFLLVGNTNSFSANIHQQGYDGLLGLGPNKGSVLHKKLSGDTGDTTLINIFKQHSSTDSYISVLLNRNADPMQKFTGQFTINEVVPGFENVTSMPKLDLNTVNRLLASDQHWQAMTDVNGITGPDGNPIVIKSIVPKAPKGQLVAVFDSGYTFSQVPRAVSDAIYGRVQGAVYDSKSQFWTVPCGQYLSISVTFGGVKYPVHPLDLVDDNFGYTAPNGTSACIGAFQPITSAFSILGQYDMILGMSFLRNTYSLFNFGEWGNEKSNVDPYIQLSSLTDLALSKQDFINIRLGGTDTTSSPRWALLPANQQQSSPIPPEEKKKLKQEKILSRWPYILLGCLALVALVLGLCIWKFCCRRKNKSTSAAARALKAKSLREPNPFSGGPASTTYLPLDEPNVAAGGVYPAGGGKFDASHYSIDSTYHANVGGGEQYPPGIHYPPTAPYGNEPKSPAKSTHSFDTTQFPPPPATQYPPSPSHYPPPQAPPQYASH